MPDGLATDLRRGQKDIGMHPCSVSGNVGCVVAAFTPTALMSSAARRVFWLLNIS